MNDHVNQHHLLEGLRYGDSGAYRQLYETFAPRLHALCTRLRLAKEDADEIVQETFIRVWLHRESLDNEKSFGAFLIAIARNIALNKIRKNAYAIRYVQELSGNADEKRPEVYEKELKAAVGSAMEELPCKCKEVFIKSRLEGYSVSQIAEEMNISKSTVENQLNKALKIIRKSLRKYGYGPAMAAVSSFLYC